ncbi:hypothetical protein EV07_0597 [Prochlorococcus sp. MIT 0603]|nr:hypothetical protein EV07_0597 [Prochlorococcus sp. MIT 0603]
MLEHCFKKAKHEIFINTYDRSLSVESAWNIHNRKTFQEFPEKF